MNSGCLFYETITLTEPLIDTIEVYDTTWVTIIDTTKISVFDTMRITVVDTAFAF